MLDRKILRSWVRALIGESRTPAGDFFLKPALGTAKRIKVSK
jgi:hypothetical protein